jgi:hypothetical protein
MDSCRLEQCVPAVPRWPREVLVPRKNSDGYDIQFQISKIQMPSPEARTEPESDLTELVAEFEAMFAIKYPHILASPRKRQRPFSFFSIMRFPLIVQHLSGGTSPTVSPRPPPCSTQSFNPRAKKVMTVEEKALQRIEALQKIEDLQLQQCTFRLDALSCYRLPTRLMADASANCASFILH